MGFETTSSRPRAARSARGRRSRGTRRCGVTGLLCRWVALPAG